MKTVVITAFYNSERFLRATVESVARQTMPPDEHILVDDASTDGSLALAEQLAVAYPYLRIIRHETNHGYPAALNTGISASESEYVAILDADDIAFPNWMEKVLPVIDADPGIGAVGGGCIIMSESGLVTGHQTYCNAKGDVTERIQNAEYLILHPGTVFRRSTLEAVGCYNTELKSIEDGDLFMGISSVARLVHTGEPHIWYRRLRRSQSRKSVEFTKCADDYTREKSDLLKQGYSVAQTNEKLKPFIEVLRAAPRLSVVATGIYHFEMAFAFEFGGRRCLAALNYAYALLNGYSIRYSAKGVVRCIIPSPVWRFGKKIWNNSI